MEAQVCSLSVIGTGSSGNGYILSCGNDKLIIECGMPFERTLETLGYDITGVCGAIVTHTHGDHAKYINEYASYFSVCSCRSVAEKYGCVKQVKPKTKFKLGVFEIIPLPVPHGDCDNYAYYIYHPLCGYTLFCTDAEYFPYKALKPSPNNIIIECNYVHDKIIERMDKGEEIRSDYHSHMEVRETIDAVRRLRGENLRNVVIVHRSLGNFDKEKALQFFMEDLQIEPIIAKAKDCIHIGKYDF